MPTSCILKDYKIPKLFYNIDIKEKGPKSLSISNSINIGISDKDVNKGLIKIETKITDNNEEIYCQFIIKGIYNFTIENITNEEKEKILKNEGIPDIYNKLREIINNIEDYTKQKLPDLPTFDEFNMEE